LALAHKFHTLIFSIPADADASIFPPNSATIQPVVYQRCGHHEGTLISHSLLLYARGYRSHQRNPQQRSAEGGKQVARGYLLLLACMLAFCFGARLLYIPVQYDKEILLYALAVAVFACRLFFMSATVTSTYLLQHWSAISICAACVVSIRSGICRGSVGD